MSNFVIPPGGNKMYMTCSGCGQDPFEMCRRTDKLYRAAKSLQYDFDEWLEKHSGCSPKPDMFRIGLEREPNWDQPIDAKPIANAVRLELINGSS